MGQGNARMFEEFDESGRERASGDLLDQVTIRPAQVDDMGAVGRISAEREGGDALEHSAGFRRSLDDGGFGRTHMVLVAEFEGEIIGFGKARCLGKEHGTGDGKSPRGWYLTGVVVDPRFRRLGVGSQLTVERLRWIADRSGVVYYFANVRNRVSIALHERFGFAEVARGAEFAGERFTGGEGVLFRADVSGLGGEHPN
jgi:ribosomal protein S18 acetylase RimI-like enzyme